MKKMYFFLLLTLIVTAVIIGCSGKDSGSSPSASDTPVPGDTATISPTSTITTTASITPTITVTPLPLSVAIDDFEDNNYESDLADISFMNSWSTGGGTTGAVYYSEIVPAPSAAYGNYSLGITFTAVTNVFDGSKYYGDCGFGVHTYTVYATDGYDFTPYSTLHFSVLADEFDTGTATEIYYIIRAVDISYSAVEYTISCTADGVIRNFSAPLNAFTQAGLKPWDEVFSNVQTIYIKVLMKSDNNGDTGGTYVLADNIYFD
ncbi:MAG: hypothetical protein JXR81_10525 [Candidatus Goldbacteria bacterium]|nr:hypothetical protein [Candidatus Goldiibacteriota bacterium]